VAASTGAAVLFMDADLSTSLADVDTVLALLATHDVVIGSRSVSGASVRRSSIVRVVMGRSFNVLMRRVTGLDVRDSQCGFKAFRGDVARTVFALAECDRFAFDPEVLRIARLLGFSMVEHPVQWVAAPRSAVRPLRDSVRTGIDLLAVRWSTRAERVEARARRMGLGSAAPPAPIVPVVPAVSTVSGVDAVSP
jgi:hypothetical protein